MNTGSLFSGPGSNSFLAPGLGSILPQVSTPSAAPSNTVFTPPPQQSGPVFQGPIAQLTPDNIAKFINDLPNMIKGLQPNDQNAFMQFLMSSDILNALFTNFTQPEAQDLINKVINTLFESGLLNQIAPDQAVMSEQTQSAVKDALQSKLVQTVLDTNNQAVAQNQNQTSTTTQTAGTTQTAQATQEAALPAQAQGTVGASQSTDNMLQLNIPVSQPGTPNQMPEQVASLIANSLTNALQLVYTGTPAGTTANPAAPNQTLETAQNMLTNLVTNLIAMQITNTQGPNAQIMIPAKSDAAGFQTQVDQLNQQLTKIGQEFAKLGELATDQKWNIGTLSNFLTVPQTLLALLKNIQPDDTSTFLFLKTFVANSPAVQTAILQRANETYVEHFDFLKTIAFASATQLPTAMVKEQEARQQQFNQILMQAPALLNVFKLKDMVAVFGDDIERKQAALLFKFKRMLFRAAHEITVVAKGVPTFEYSDVGVFHELLVPLAERIAITLPQSAESLSFELMEIISHDIVLTFTYIQENEPHRLNDILKRHPRTLLYLRSIDSDVTRDVQFPRTESLGELPDAATLNIHFERIMKVVKNFEKNSEFIKFQPKVLEAFIDEAKYDPQSVVTKNSMDIVHKAIADSSGFIDLDSPD